MTFALNRKTNELKLRRVRLARRTELAPNYLRVRLEGEDLWGFDSPGCDDHLRIFLATPGSDEPRDWPSREYTPVAWDGEGWLDLDLVLHPTGLVSSWAREAAIGDEAAIGGPRGSMILDGRPESWLLAGDETAVPAIVRFLTILPEGAGSVLIEVPDADHEVPDALPAKAEVTWLHRGHQPGAEASSLTKAIEALSASDRPDGSVFGFIAGEQSVVAPGRALLHERWGLDSDQTVVKGYWKRGDEQYHAPH